MGGSVHRDSVSRAIRGFDDRNLQADVRNRREYLETNLGFPPDLAFDFAAYGAFRKYGIGCPPDSPWEDFMVEQWEIIKRAVAEARQ